MTTAVKEKKPFLPQRKPAASTSLAIPGSKAPAARSAVATAALTIGGEPRVHLLPADVAARKNLKIVKGRLWIAVIVVAVLAAVAYGGVLVSLTAAQAQLASANSSATQLLAQQSKYGDVSKVQADINSIKSAQTTTTEHEILWAKYMHLIQASLPSGAAIVTMNGAVDNATAAAPAAPAVPLQSEHIATLNVTASMPQAAIARWVAGLPSIDGFVDATPGSVTIDPKGGYFVQVTILMDKNSLSNRFAKAVK